MKTKVRASLAVLALSLGLSAPLLADQSDEALAAYNRKDYATVLHLLRPLAEEGDVKAQIQLGFMYHNGEGVPQDYAEAMKWSRKAADQGYAKAEFNLGVMFAAGQGVQQDYAEAVKWYRKAADQGLAQAEYNLGVMFAAGQGVQQDYAEAMKWSRKAADQGLAQAEYNLGVMFAGGQGVQQDYAEAVKWYRKAADQGLAQAEYNLGVMYRDGMGVPRDWRAAVMLFRKAADQGNIDAKRNLDIMDASSAQNPTPFPAEAAAPPPGEAVAPASARASKAADSLLIDFKGVPLDMPFVTGQLRSMCLAIEANRGFDKCSGNFVGMTSMWISYGLINGEANIIVDDDLSLTQVAMSADWTRIQTLVGSLTAKYGEPTRTTRQVQNKRGATFDQEIFIWTDSRGSRITVKSRHGRIDGGLLHIESAKSIRAQDATDSLLIEAAKSNL